jgi:hypothetical protein
VDITDAFESDQKQKTDTLPDLLNGWFALRWILLFLWPVGWWMTSDFWADSWSQYAQYSIWTIVAATFAALFLYRMRDDWFSLGHLWLIFIVMVAGYYLKWYVLVNVLAFSTDETLLDMLTPYVSPRSTPDILLEAFATATVAFGAFCAVCVLITRRPAGAPRGRPGAEGRTSRSPDEQSSQVRTHLVWLLSVSTLASVLTLALQAATRSAVVSADEVVLPYRLGGIIQLARTTAIPALFLLVAFLADRAGQRFVNATAAGLYFVHNLASGIWSTSKQPVIFAVAGLAVLWMVTGQLTRRRLALLLTAVPMVLLVTTLLGLMRTLRSNGDLGLVASLPEAVYGLTAEGTVWQSLLQSALALLMRVNGIDTLTWIVAFEPQVDPGRTSWMLFQAGSDVNALFAEDVLGLRDLTGVAFSTSLVGFFYFLLGSKWLAALGIVTYTLLWHAVLGSLQRATLICRPVLLVLAWVLVAFFTIDGNLQALPQSLIFFLIVIGGVELLARLVLKAEPYFI